MAHPYFETDTLHLVVFAAAFALWTIPELLISFRRRSKPDSLRKDRGSLQTLVVTFSLGLFAAFFLAFRLPEAEMRADPATIFTLGIILILVGIALRWYAIYTLGRFFTRDVATQAGQVVIQTGPYRLIRHPSYAGLLIAMFGLGLALTNWASLIALVVITTIGFLFRISIEERALVEALGEPYRHYMQRTRRLIPFIW
jgi:protein-S-isoprenylcysteine O-methyltransferase Ste14